MKEKQKFAGTAALMGVIILAAKVMGLLRDVMVAGSYGTTTAAIAYETASKLPVTVFDLVLGGVVTSAFIPVYNSLSVKEGKGAALAFAQSYLNFILAVTTGIAVLGGIFAPALVSFMAPELDAVSRAMAVDLTRIMFPMVIFCGTAFSFVGYLQSEGEFNIPALISLVSNLMMVGYLLFFNRFFGITGLAFAMVLGWAAQAVVQIPAMRKRGFRYSIKAKLNTEPIRRAAKNTLPILIGTWTSPICNLINTRLASGIEGGRAITALGYANRLYTIIVGVFSFVATNLLFPYFSRAAASGDKDEANRLIRTSVKVLSFIIAPISAGIMVLAKPFTALIYEHGDFTASDTLITAEALGCYAVGMVFCAVNEVLTKAFFAAERTKVPMISAICSMGFNILAVVVFGERLGVGGIALVSGVAVMVNMAINGIVAKKTAVLLPTWGDGLDLLKSVISAAIMGGVVYFVYGYTLSMGTLLSLMVSVGAGIAVYAALTILLRSEEMMMLKNMLIKKENTVKDKDRSNRV